jgi:bis(5'-nucleosyl)-tetraphosphatase (symmetrical)
MAHLAEKTLQRDDYIQFFKVMYGNQPNIWSDDLQGMEKLRFIINCFTRIRYCEKNGRLDFNHNGPLGTQPKHLHPWFKLQGRKMAARTIIFGHWSSLGYYEGNNCYGIDTGCLWGGQLTVLKLGKKIKRISVTCSGYRKIG